jgi:hypothetical protein
MQMMSQRVGRRVLLSGFILVAWSNSVCAQDVVTAPGFYSAPGYYGTSYGVPSYKSIRTYSEFASPCGAGYAYGYPPTSIGAGRFGSELWRGSSALTNPLDGASLHSYRTFAVPYQAKPTVVAPPFGVYAPAYGPSRPFPPSAYFGR